MNRYHIELKDSTTQESLFIMETPNVRGMPKPFSDFWLNHVNGNKTLEFLQIYGLLTEYCDGKIVVNLDLVLPFYTIHIKTTPIKESSCLII